MKGRKDGRWIFYQLVGDGSPVEVKEAIAWVKKSLSQNERIQQDRKCLEEILKIDREVLCSRQSSTSECETNPNPDIDEEPCN